MVRGCHLQDIWYGDAACLCHTGYELITDVCKGYEGKIHYFCSRKACKAVLVRAFPESMQGRAFPCCRLDNNFHCLYINGLFDPFLRSLMELSFQLPSLTSTPGPTWITTFSMMLSAHQLSL